MKRALALLLAAVALADNVTTWLAVQRGAVELNPLVSFFLSNPILYWFFTAFKVVACFTLAYKTYSKSPWWTATYALVLAVFTRATIVNALNSLH